MSDHTLTKTDRCVGYTGPRSSSLLLAWLASHRGRLHALILGGRRLGFFVIWDTKGNQAAPRSEADVRAVYQLVYGQPMPPEGENDA